jgi:hypothetical protein
MKDTKESIVEKTYSDKISPPLGGRGCPYNDGLISKRAVYTVIVRNAGNEGISVRGF